MEVRAEMDTRSSGIIVRLGFCLEPGQSTMTPEELGRWVTSVYEDARQLLLQRMANGDAARRCLLRYGWRHWEPPVAEHPGASFFQEEENDPPSLTARPDAERMQEPISEALPPALPVETPPEPPVIQTHPSRLRTGPRVEQTASGKNIIGVLKRAGQPLDIATVKKQTKLTDYTTRITLKRLCESGLVVEAYQEIGGRWGSKAVHSLA